MKVSLAMLRSFYDLNEEEIKVISSYLDRFMEGYNGTSCLVKYIEMFLFVKCKIPRMHNKKKYDRYTKIFLVAHWLKQKYEDKLKYEDIRKDMGDIPNNEVNIFMANMVSRICDSFCLLKIYKSALIAELVQEIGSILYKDFNEKYRINCLNRIISFYVSKHNGSKDWKLIVKETTEKEKLEIELYWECGIVVYD